MKHVFTTGQVAKICNVVPRTVAKWCDSGRLRSYRIPGSQDRRIARDMLIAFLRDHGMPGAEALEAEQERRVLLVSQDEILTSCLMQDLRALGFSIVVATGGFDAGVHAEGFRPDCVTVDFSIGKLEALQICHNLRTHGDFANAVLIALLPKSPLISFDRSAIDETFVKPFDGGLFAERLNALLDSKGRVAPERLHGRRPGRGQLRKTAGARELP